VSKGTISGSEADASGRPRLRGAELRGGLAASLRFGLGGVERPGVRLGVGERVVDGRVYYSAAWLDRAPVSDRQRRSRREGLLLAQAWSPLCCWRRDCERGG
jgi:hypothetical protein